ncbi:MAG: nitroreductase/quinone reductase family protein [Myxococcota bacterium]
MRRLTILVLTLGLTLAGPTGCITAVGIFQPENVGGETIVITTFDKNGDPWERVITPIDDGGRLVVAANHWPRAWYYRALQNPDVQVKGTSDTTDYRAVPVSDEERDRLLDESGFPWFAYVLTGFAPREFLVLEPR